jgi:hypothetical protein
VTVVQPGHKGYLAEEALRRYFNGLGFFAVRNVPFIYESFDVTDIDLWLYMKASALTRERTCVDIKRKKTPQAMERVFWTKGLQEALRVERSIVVTTDNRQETRDFGAAHGVVVLHGDFLQDVVNKYVVTERLTEEELFLQLKTPCIVNPKIIWSQWFRNVKSTLIDGLNFNGCNKFLVDIKLLIEEYLASGKNFYPPIRLLYILIAYFILTLDYISCSLAHIESGERNKAFDDGLRYGEAGRARTDEIVNMALHLLAESGKASLFSRDNLKQEFQRQLSEYPAEMLAEYFSKSEVLSKLFRLSQEFEGAAYTKNLVLPHESSSEQKAIIGLLCDFLQIDRRNLI